MKQNRNVASKLLDKKWKERDLMIHKRKLREVKSAIRPQQDRPFYPDTAMRNAKKDALLERKFSLFLYKWLT